MRKGLGFQAQRAVTTKSGSKALESRPTPTQEHWMGETGGSTLKSMIPDKRKTPQTLGLRG